MEKIWKEIKNHTNYKINNLGEVLSIKRNKLLTPRKTDRGYLTVLLYYDCGKKYKSYRIHRLVLSSFNDVDYSTHKLECNHIDEDKTNNKLDNLCWVTRQENMEWNNLQSRIKRTGPKDINKWKQIISQVNRKSIIGISIKDKSIIEFVSMADAKKNGFNAGNISSCCLGKRSKHKGYNWKFK